MAPECSEGTTKGLGVTKSLSSYKSQRLTLDIYIRMNKNNMVIPSNAIISMEKLLIDFTCEEFSKFL